MLAASTLSSNTTRTSHPRFGAVVIVGIVSWKTAAMPTSKATGRVEEYFGYVASKLTINERQWSFIRALMK
ncbi:unnamed protein product [Toxocara canis]|uniref:Transposase n=1 Tax=Toxocara canis TaxID=6265 RepID=A0A183TZM7_TOXCA|nr:unnamed protein product [Toxocara canis]